MADVYRKFDDDVDAYGSYQYTGDDRFSSRWANERLTRAALASVELDSLRVVDIGCGDGTYTAELARRGRPSSIVGIDPAARAIERATTTYATREDNLSFITGDSTLLMERTEHFDVAIYRGVIHHLDDPESEFRRAFKIADKVLFLEPNGLNPLLKVLEKVSKYHREHEERSFTTTTFRRWVERGGGRISRTFFCGFVPFFAPLWYAKIAAAVEPFLESTPFFRALLCAQVCIVAESLERR